MKITIDTNSYNHRRWSQPWIATVDFTNDTKGKFSFGDWIGDRYKGSAGILVIDATPGQIVAEGQKDNRGNGTARNYHVVLPTGKLKFLGDKVAAYKHCTTPKPNPMGRAWEIRRAAADKFGCKVSEISMSECLKQAWKEIR